MSVEVMKQALEALSDCTYDEEGYCLNPENVDAILALRAAIEQAQEPVAWVLKWVENGEQKHHRLYDNKRKCFRDAELDGGVCRPLVYGDVVQPQMQPCAGRNCGSTNPNLHSAECFEDYEKSTGMNQRKPLTNEQLKQIVAENVDGVTVAESVMFRMVARAIEAAHGIKGEA